MIGFIWNLICSLGWFIYLILLMLVAIILIIFIGLFTKFINWLFK